ncbi:hypothetical protein SAMN04515695_2799 [Pseudovibrio sp. Tun.PSC04-5.I4]|nr:hypothetical protein SAMN04515695_2799 [Pseudovibrio sp. Tun.PSC04-5.I4]
MSSNIVIVDNNLLSLEFTPVSGQFDCPFYAMANCRLEPIAATREVASVRRRSMLQGDQSRHSHNHRSAPAKSFPLLLIVFVSNRP